MTDDSITTIDQDHPEETMVPLKKNKKPLEFSPTFLIRAHSKNDDPADILTQVIQCEFEPDPELPFEQKLSVATCGGNTVSVINTKNGSNDMKYTRKTKNSASDNIFSLAWTTLTPDSGQQLNVLAVGGGRSTVILIDTNVGVAYDMFITNSKQQHVPPIICSLLFHPVDKCLLFCGDDSGTIELWNIDCPNPPDYEIHPTHITTFEAPCQVVHKMAYSLSEDILVAGCETGIYIWKKPVTSNINPEEESNKSYYRIRPPYEEEDVIVDSICLLRDKFIIFKIVNSGKISIFSLLHLEERKKEVSKSKKPMMMQVPENKILTLKWKKSDATYIDMDVDQESCILACGDDSGKVWIYDLFDIITGTRKSQLSSGHRIVQLIKPTRTIKLPVIIDEWVENAKKIKPGNDEIVIEKVSISKGGRQIVAGTSNNLIVVWNRSTTVV